METKHVDNSPIVVIVGPTASGKTDLAVRIAEKFNGEIISADSRAIYKGLDIGTAKPSLGERKTIPHWGIDLVEPGERFTAYDFKQYANERISDIISRHKLPILVGGTGLYVDSVIYDFEFTSKSNNIVQRKELEQRSLDWLINEIKRTNKVMPKNEKNKRHLVNALLRDGELPKKNSSIKNNIILLGILTDKKILRKRIENRANNIVKDATIHEAITTAKRYGWENEAMTGNVYPLIHQYVMGTMTIDTVRRKMIISDWRLAKRQMTWFSRNKDINWIRLEDSDTYIANRLADIHYL